MTHDDPCILFALARERRPLRRHFATEAVLSRQPELRRLAMSNGRAACTLLTGAGERRMREALAWLLHGPKIGGDPYRPRLLISAGFSGALVADLRVGDLLLGTEVAAESGERWQCPAPVPWPESIPCRRGAILSVNRFVTQPEEKRLLAGCHGAQAVDMESAVVAAACHQHGVPFGCVRVISDDVHTPLSHHLDRIVVDGRVSAWGLVKTVARSPGIISELCRLGKQTRLAADRLAMALAALIHTMP